MSPPFGRLLCVLRDTYELIGERTNRHFRWGKKVRIRVEAADTLTRTIDFLLVEDRDEDR